MSVICGCCTNLILAVFSPASMFPLISIPVCRHSSLGWFCLVYVMRSACLYVLSWGFCCWCLRSHFTLSLCFSLRVLLICFGFVLPRVLFRSCELCRVVRFDGYWLSSRVVVFALVFAVVALHVFYYIFRLVLA